MLISHLSLRCICELAVSAQVSLQVGKDVGAQKFLATLGANTSAFAVLPVALHLDADVSSFSYVRPTAAADNDKDVGELVDCTSYFVSNRSGPPTTPLPRSHAHCH